MAAQSKPKPVKALEPTTTHEATLDEIDPRYRTPLSAWMDKYVAKKAEIDMLTAELEEIKLDHIEPLRLRLGLTKIDADSWYIARRAGRPSLDKDKAKLYLVNKGVSVKLVTDAFDTATSKGKPFTEIKRKKSEKE